MWLRNCIVLHIRLIAFNRLIAFFREDLDLLYWDVYVLSLHSSVSITEATHRWLLGSALLEMQG